MRRMVLSPDPGMIARQHPGLGQIKTAADRRRIRAAVAADALPQSQRGLRAPGQGGPGQPGAQVWRQTVVAIHRAGSRPAFQAGRQIAAQCGFPSGIAGSMASSRRVAPVVPIGGERCSRFRPRAPSPDCADPAGGRAAARRPNPESRVGGRAARPLRRCPDHGSATARRGRGPARCSAPCQAPGRRCRSLCQPSSRIPMPRPFRPIAERDRPVPSSFPG